MLTSFQHAITVVFPMSLGQNLVNLVNIKIAGKWVFTSPTLIIIGFDTHPYVFPPIFQAKKKTIEQDEDLDNELLTDPTIQAAKVDWATLGLEFR